MISFELLPSFKRKIKQYAKKFKGIKKDLISLQNTLKENPTNAIPIRDNDIFKIRLANSSLNKGKSSGYRVYYYYLDSESTITLMYIYSKNDQANLSDEDLDKLILELEVFMETKNKVNDED
ncbi:MAG: hypothetical protein Q9M39_04540 [Sulfurovum sp.]|nr:hypothetical protein [Sulfurovum sp.]